MLLRQFKQSPEPQEAPEANEQPTPVPFWVQAAPHATKMNWQLGRVAERKAEREAAGADVGDYEKGDQATEKTGWWPEKQSAPGIMEGSDVDADGRAGIAAESTAVSGGVASSYLPRRGMGKDDIRYRAMEASMGSTLR